MVGIGEKRIMENLVVKEDKKLAQEQEVPMFQYNSAIEQLVEIRKKEKDDLDHQIVLAKSRLKDIKEDTIKRESEFNQRLIADEQKFKNELSKRHNQLIEQENRINVLHNDLQQRSKDLLVKEERYLKVDEERKKIVNDRIEIEKMRVAAHNLMSEADRKVSEANSMFAQANEHVKKSKQLDDKNAIRNQELVKREDKLKFDMKNLEMECNHLIELQEGVEPKIVELKQIEDRIKADKADIDNKHQEIINKADENKIGLKALEDRKNKLDQLEKQLRAREDKLDSAVLTK